MGKFLLNARVWRKLPGDWSASFLIPVHLNYQRVGRCEFSFKGGHFIAREYEYHFCPIYASGEAAKIAFFAKRKRTC
jgi:hypothetical protein